MSAALVDYNKEFLNWSDDQIAFAVIKNQRTLKGYNEAASAINQALMAPLYEKNILEKHGSFDGIEALRLRVKSACISNDDKMMRIFKLINGHTNRIKLKAQWGIPS